MTEPAKTTLSESEKNDIIVNYSWMIRPCIAYYDEHAECKSFKARFHQYFIYGEMLDCSQWKTDYKTCKSWDNDRDVEAGVILIKSEIARRAARLKGHFENDIWTRRKEPPDDWNKPLPENILIRQKNSLLALQSKGVSEGTEKASFSNTFTFGCSIM